MTALRGLPSAYTDAMQSAGGWWAAATHLLLGAPHSHQEILSPTPELRPATGVGVGANEPSSNPSCPVVLEPQQRTPSSVTAQLVSLVVAIAVTPEDMLLTGAGTLQSVSVSLPNCPKLLRPQQVTAPLASAQLCSLPTAINVTGADSPVTRVGR